VWNVTAGSFHAPKRIQLMIQSLTRQHYVLWTTCYPPGQQLYRRCWSDVCLHDRAAYDQQLKCFLHKACCDICGAGSFQFCFV